MKDMRDYNLLSHSSAYCHVQIEKDDETNSIQVNFISYQTAVCGISYIDGNATLWCKGNYSRSTIKQIGWFTESFCGENLYYSIKNELLYCDKMNRKHDTCFEYATIDMSEKQKKAFLHAVEMYQADGVRWYKYSKEPNWYDNSYSNLNVIILP